MSMTLSWKDATRLPVEAEILRPDLLANFQTVEVLKLALQVGRDLVELGDLFDIEGNLDDHHLVIEGDLRHVRQLGQGMGSGRMTIRGDVGSRLGEGMAGGSIELFGNAGDRAGANMRGGMLHIRGSAGHLVGAAAPGERRGMCDGVILVEGSIGDDAGLTMRRGLIAVAGSTGEGLGRGMIAGSIFTFGTVGRYPGAGMKRGTIAKFGPSVTDPPLLPTFRLACRHRPPFLTLYLRRLRAWGFPVPESAFKGLCERYNGDSIEQGQGEILIWRPDL